MRVHIGGLFVWLPWLCSGDTDVLYGVMTNNKPEYREKLIAQLDTWAAGLPDQGRFFALTGTGGDTEGISGLIVSSCSDGYNGIPCKEEQLIENGYKRGAEWLAILGEDNYVDTALFEKSLAARRSDSPVALGLLGCKTDPKFCPEAADKPSLCGGGGYVLNRAALAALLEPGADALRSDYDQGVGHQGDLITSCMLHRRGIDIAELSGLVGYRETHEKALMQLVQEGPLTLHYMTPWTMRWVHAQLIKKPDIEVKALEMEAFENGCCCWASESQKKQCEKEESPRSLSFMSFSKMGLIPLMRTLHIERQNALAAANCNAF